jgi:hypothetical protein
MPTPLLESAAKVIGICGPLLTAGKSVVLFVEDQSLERKQRKMVQEITECLNRVNTLEACSPTDLQLEPYRLQIIGDLQALIAELVAVREKKLLLEARRDKESTGIRRWLLLYRPEGLNGWLTQSFFFGTCAAVVFIVIETLRKTSTDVAALGFSVVIIGVWLLYSRSVSLRVKHVGILKRGAGIRELNSDLHWIRRALLLFKPSSMSALVVHGFFYLYGLTVLYPLQEPMGTSLKGIALKMGLIVSLLLTAKVFQIDALARRALDTELAKAPQN